MKAARLNEIDLLRFLAALSVVFFHYAFRGYTADSMTIMPYPLLAGVAKYGYLGVQLFFMISGFVILMTAAAGNLQSFAVSRIVRLYPAFWACCTITFLAILLIGEPRYAATYGQYLVNMTMLSGFVGVPDIDGVYWSLFVEIRFYALVALVLLAGRIHQAQSLILAWLVASIALEAYPIGKLRFLLIVDYSAFFIAGATYYLIWSKGLSPTRLGMICGALGLAIGQTIKDVSATALQFNTPMNHAVAIVLVAAFFVAFMLIALGRTGPVGRANWVLVGALTYPLYLLHQNIGFMMFNAAYPAVSAHLLFWGAIGSVLLLAYAVHALVERRFSSWMKRALNGGLDRARLLASRALTSATGRRPRT